MNAPTRIAIVGTDNIARIHARALAAVPAGNATIVAATDVDPGSLASFAAEFGVPATFRGVAGLLGGARPDLVHICTPAAFTGRIIQPGDIGPGTPFYDTMNGGYARA